MAGQGETVLKGKRVDLIGYNERLFFYTEGGETWEQVAQQSCWMPESVQGQVGCTFEQSDLVGGVPASCREAELGDF